MKIFLNVLILFLPGMLSAEKQDDPNLFFRSLAKLEFAEAKRIAALQKDSALRGEMLQLADILYYEGQVSRDRFRTPNNSSDDDIDPAVVIIRELETGYISLFYDPVKGNAFKHFHHAYQTAKENGNAVLIKPCLLGLLKYYNNEIAQNSDAYQPYLKHFESLAHDTIDEVWTTVYKMIFYSKALNGIDTYYYQLSEAMAKYENSFRPNDPMLTHIYYEKAVQFDIQNNVIAAARYYKKTLEQALDYPFLRGHRFFCHIKLTMMKSQQGNFIEARRHLKLAKYEINQADTLRSNYYLNLYGSFFLNAIHHNDTAFALLKTAYSQDFQLDFRRNTLEINRLAVELETQEKENANLKLQQDRIWLLSALGMAGVLLLAGYFFFVNQRSITRIELQDKEVRSMKLEKQLKDQEISGFDRMIEGQEKERQRIANDLHDNLGSLLTTLRFHFHHIKSKVNSPEADQTSLYQKTDDLLEEAYQKVRAIAHARNAGVDPNEGLVPAVRHFASKVSIINQLVIEVEDHGMDERLENSLEITIFRIIQELITNVIKHAHATEAFIHLTRHENSINVMVEDNGIGFNIHQIKPTEAMGLYSIQKRIENAGGAVTIDSVPGKGTTIIIDIPLT
jgi:signal transduction histidine kinase